MNKHAENMKKALLDYKKLRETADARIQYIRETYGNEAGEAEKEIQTKKLERARSEAVNTITAAGGAGRKEAEAWGHMDGSKMNSDDIKLLDAGLVDKAEFNRLKAKHADNFTMLQVLRKYGEKQNRAETEEARKNNPDGFIMEEPFDLHDIPAADDKAKRWERTQASALDLLDCMDGVGKYSNPHDWGAAFIKAAMPENLEHFGEDL